MMKSGKMNAVMEDISGNWWIGGDNGLVRYSRGATRPELIHLGENNSADVLAIYQDRKAGIWFGTSSHGLYYMPDALKPSVLQHFSKVIVDGKQEVVDNIFSINQDEFENMWFGSFINGVFILNRNTNRFVHYTTFNNDPVKGRVAVSQIIKDKQGTMWVSTWTNGFNKFIPENNDPAKGKFIHYTHDPGNANSLSFSITSCMKEDSDGNLWIGTVSGGLNKFKPSNGNFTRFSTNNGLPSNLIYRIEEDKTGNIWFSTDEGISMLSKATGSIINFKEEDGLPTRSFYFLSSFSMRDGTIAFGTIDGNLVHFQPEGFAKNEQTPVIVDFKLFNRSLETGEYGVFNKPVYLADTFHINYNQSVFTFEFSNFDFINPDIYTFAYKLKESKKNGIT